MEPLRLMHCRLKLSAKLVLFFDIRKFFSFFLGLRILSYLFGPFYVVFCMFYFLQINLPHCSPMICPSSATYLHRDFIGTSSEPHRNFAESLPIHCRYLKPPQRSLHAPITACFFLISLHNSKKCCTFAGGKDKTEK